MSKKTVKLIGVTFATLLMAIQFVPVDRNNPPVTDEIDASPAVMDILKRSCYNCHSNETHWPWYSHVAPVSWMLARDVHEGREEVNFSEWGRLNPEKKAKKLEDIGEEVGEGGMPLPIYLITHREARLSDADRELIKAWAGNSR